MAFPIAPKRDFDSPPSLLYFSKKPPTSAKPSLIFPIKFVQVSSNPSVIFFELLTCIYICEKEMCGSESESAVKVASVKAVIDCEKRCVEVKVDAVICILQI